jgi:hypothetical protein
MALNKREVILDQYGRKSEQLDGYEVLRKSDDLGRY